MFDRHRSDTLDVDPTLEANLRRMFHGVALRTPLDAPAPRPSRQRPVLRIALATGLAVGAASIVTAVVMTDRPDDSEPQSDPPVSTAVETITDRWTPPGTEAPMTPAAPRFDIAGPAEDPIGPERWFAIPGLGVQAVYEADIDGRRSTCVTVGEPIIGGTVCAASASSFGAAADATWQARVMRDLPADVAFVSFAADDEQHWLRPIGGLAILGTADGELRGIHFWRTDGSEVVIEGATVDWSPPGREVTYRSTEAPSWWSGFEAFADRPVVNPIAPGTLRWYETDEGGVLGTYVSAFAGESDGWWLVSPMSCFVVPTQSEAQTFTGSECGNGAGFNQSFSARGGPALDWVAGQGLTEAVAYVEFKSAGQPRWLRPLDGAAWLATPDGDITFDGPKLYSSDGGLLRSAEAYRTPDSFRDVSLRVDGPPDEEAVRSARRAFEEALDNCLRSSGADPSTGEFTGSGDPAAVWQSCIDAAARAASELRLPAAPGTGSPPPAPPQATEP